MGQLASAAGLTVRTLHHYDHIGLVRPSGRTASGHRLYQEPDVARLYQVLALRQLGLGLDTVGEVLAGSSAVDDVRDGAIVEVEAGWAELLPQVTHAVESGMDPASPPAQTRAARR